MKRRKLILGGLIFVLLFLLLPIAVTRTDDSNMTGSWNGKHGQVVLVGKSWLFFFLIGLILCVER